MTVNICGIKYDVIPCEDSFGTDENRNFGQTDYAQCVIKYNKDLADAVKVETICHEMVHAMLTHLGYNEESENETFVQGLANAISQGFYIREVERWT